MLVAKLMGFQSLFGLLSVTGLRIGEALHLRVSDVDLEGVVGDSIHTCELLQRSRAA